LPTSRHAIDQDYLPELMNAFPVDSASPVDLKTAQRKIQLRHNVLSWENRVELLEIFTEESFFQDIKLLPKTLHLILYKNILSNAGDYRQSYEPNSGVVRFGPAREYCGTPPDYIGKRITQAVSLLEKHSLEPIHCALKFYQRFVYIHPFYDANGRIGRFIASLYLHYHQFIIDWEHLERNGKWLKTLNACHDRMTADSVVYERFVGYMVYHWSKSIHQFSHDE